MHDIYSWELWFIREFQNAGEWLTPVMEFFTWSGYPQGYIVIIAMIYWSFDSRTGMRMAIFLSLISALNGLLKQLFHAPRPYWADPGIKAFHSSNGFGMPSGHAQASTVWLLAAFYMRNKWFWIIVIVLAFMIGLSRVYLGVHFPDQVIAGWLAGSILLIIYIRLESSVIRWMRNLKLIYQSLIVVAVSVLFMLTGGLLVRLLKHWEMPAEWIINASVYMSGENETILSSISLGAIAGNAGGFLGAALGIILIARAGGFITRGTWWKRLLRCLIGLTIITGLYMCLIAIAPDNENLIMYYIWRYFGFCLLAFSVIYLIPILFLKTNLVSACEKNKSA